MQDTVNNLAPVRRNLGTSPNLHDSLIGASFIMQITMFKGGTAEKTVAVESIQIPDLWHIAQCQDAQDQAKILEVWHTCHELKNALLRVKSEEPL